MTTLVAFTDATASIPGSSPSSATASLISSEAVAELGLEPGMLAVASVKATNVVIELPPIAACGSTSTSGPSASPDPLSGLLTVFAASSLTSAFNTAEKGLELDHPGF